MELPVLPVTSLRPLVREEFARELVLPTLLIATETNSQMAAKSTPRLTLLIVVDVPIVALPTTSPRLLVLGEFAQELVRQTLLTAMATNSQMAAKSTC